MGLKKNQDIQMIRGLCMAAVVLIHSGSAAEMQFVSGQEWQFWYWVMLRQIINFAVGTFFFLSGYLVDQQKVNGAPLRFISRRVVRLAIPFVVWSGIYSLKTILIDWPDVDWLSAILHFVAGKVAAPFYFILVLLQLNLLTPALLRAQNKPVTRTVIWCLSPAYLVALGAYCVINGTQPPLYETVFPAWLIYYWAGLRWKSGRKYSVRGWYVAVALGIAMLDAVILVTRFQAASLAPSQVRLATVPYALLLATWLISHRFPLPAKTAWKYIGNHSYGVFYIHCLMLSITEKVVIAIGAGQNVLLSQVVNWTGSLCLSLVACIILEKMFGRQRAEKWLGV